MEEKDEKSNLKKVIFERVIPILFVVWFIGSIGGLLYCTEYEPKLLGFIIGQYFIVFGCIPLLKKSLIGLIGIIIGLEIIAFSVLIKWGNVIGLESINIGKWIVITMLIDFFFVGIGFLIMPIISEYVNMRKCKFHVVGKIIKFKSKRDTSGSRVRIVYAPILEYMYNAQRSTFETNNYAPMFIWNKNKEYDLYINEHDISEIYFKKPMSLKIIISIIGISFILASCISLYMYLLK